MSKASTQLGGAQQPTSDYAQKVIFQNPSELSLRQYGRTTRMSIESAQEVRQAKKPRVASSLQKRNNSALQPVVPTGHLGSSARLDHMKIRVNGRASTSCAAGPDGDSQASLKLARHLSAHMPSEVLPADYEHHVLDSAKQHARARPLTSNTKMSRPSGSKSRYKTPASNVERSTKLLQGISSSNKKITETISEVQALTKVTSAPAYRLTARKQRSTNLKQDFALFIPQNIDFTNLGMSKDELRAFN